MSCPSKSYSFNDQQRDAAVALAASNGIHIDPGLSQAGTSVHGCKLDWTINADTITFQITSKPFYISCDQIFGELDKLFSPSSSN
jgi:hypothetical protein